MNTFEIVVDLEGGELKVDHAYFVTRKDQCQSPSCSRTGGGS